MSGKGSTPLVDWTQAPEWAGWYAKDRDNPAWPHIKRSTWREVEPAWFAASSPYGQWSGGDGRIVDAPDFGAADEWGLVKRP